MEDPPTNTAGETRPKSPEVQDEPVVFIKKKRNKNLQATLRYRKDDHPKESLEEEIEEEDEDSRGTTIEDLIALRRLKQAKVGIELQRLNAGEPKKKKKKKNASGAATETVGGGSGSLKSVSDSAAAVAAAGETLDGHVREDRLADDEHEDEDARTRKIIKSNHFTQQTNTLDVDKHMMAYIEEELQRRRTAAIAAGTLESTEPILKGEDAIASLDPRDELYKIAEKYRIQKKPVVEGNVTLSATMLTSIPEVDLGIDNRIRNFEATEKAKRQLSEQRGKSGSTTAPGGVGSNSSGVGGRGMMVEAKEHFAADRFLLPNHLKPNPIGELDSLKIARLEAEGHFEEADALRKDLKRKAYQLKYGNNYHPPNNIVSANNPSANHRFASHPPHRSNQLATDDRAVENFRKRMGGRR